MFRLTRSGYIEIDLIRRQLSHYQGSTLAGSYPVAIGKPSTPSPVGEWSIINKKILNYDSVFGTRWMGLNNPGYGVHGTNNPSSIGKAISHGCVRMYNHHVEELFTRVSLGTKVIITNGGSSPPANYNDYQAPSYNYNTPNNNYSAPNNSDHSARKTYQIKSGDTLWSISERMNVPLNELIKANPNIDPNNLHVGQLINLP
ncbi:MAG: L,D-transpeptidase family protein [Peptococcaceae bacterium]